MSNDHLRMTPQPRLDPPRLPIPAHDVALAVPAADPFTIRRKPDLARVARNGVAREPLLAVLPEVVCVVDEDLVVERLSGEVFLWRGRSSDDGAAQPQWDRRVRQAKKTYSRDEASPLALSACVAQLCT